MKLQPKRQVNAEVATHKKAQIDEGVKLAGKIDVLRETLAKEEGNLRQFREGSVKAVREEIDTLITDKENLKGDIVSLERRKAEALAPLDAEWAKIEQEKDAIQKSKISLNQAVFELNEREKGIAKAEQETGDEKERAKDLKRIASENLAQSEEVLADSQKAAFRIRVEAQATLDVVQSKEKLAHIKEEELKEREAEVEKVWQKVRDKESELAGRERALKDARETLQRTINRNKHG